MYLTDRKIWFSHSKFLLSSYVGFWQVNNPQPKVFWYVSSSLMILILKAKLFHFLCNIPMVSFMNLKTFNPGGMLTIITSIFVTSEGKFSNQYIYARHKENDSAHRKYLLSLEATCHYLHWWNSKNSKTSILYFHFSFPLNTKDYWKHFCPGCLPKRVRVPFP